MLSALSLTPIATLPASPLGRCARSNSPQPRAFISSATILSASRWKWLDINSAQGGQRNTGADIANNSAATQGGLVDEANQRLTEAYQGVFRAFVKHRTSVEMVTFWGPNDANSWRRNGQPLLFDADSEPKPAFHAVIAEAKETVGAK